MSHHFRHDEAGLRSETSFTKMSALVDMLSHSSFKGPLTEFFAKPGKRTRPPIRQVCTAMKNGTSSATWL